MNGGLRTVLIGFGRIGSTEAVNERKARFYRYASHVQALIDHPGFELVGVADPDESARTSARYDWGVPHVAESAEELTELHPEVVVLAIPPVARLEVLKSIPGVRAVLVEKPLGVTAMERNAFVDYCRGRGLVVQVNYFRRADATYRALAGGELEARIGAPQAVFGLYGRGLYNIAVHFVDLARMLLGEVAWVRALGGQSRGEVCSPGDPNLPFALGFADGLVGSFLTVDYGLFREGGLDVWGSKGRLSLLMEGLLGIAYPAAMHRALEDRREISSDRPEILPPTLGEAYYGMYDNLFATLSGRDSLWSPMEEALLSESVADAVLLSAASGGECVHPGSLG